MHRIILMPLLTELNFSRATLMHIAAKITDGVLMMLVVLVLND